MRVRGKHVILSLVLFSFGFLIAFSYQHTKALIKDEQTSVQEWEKTFYYRQQLIQFEENNHQLQQEIDDVRLNILQLENTMADQIETMSTRVSEKLELQALTGELPIEGSGIFVSLKDQEFIPSESNVDQYIVHDRHIQLVINELYSAGAEALAINGQRIFSDSRIVCIGPVISIDDEQYPAPFVIEAIGDPDILQESLELSNGVIDLLVNDQIEVEIGKKDQIKMNARMS
ncbi:DUF881 domain-containing protein [Amphibacillus sp. Q70]|uniref:DUF881 domain-containing protein n=1 Tax=Amphibacillus sp. Q70 TaxID=3453416 RepID=UPI003F83B83D